MALDREAHCVNLDTVVAGCPASDPTATARCDLATADPVAAPTPVRRGLRLPRWVAWVLLALPLGIAAYGFVYVNRPEACYRRALEALGRDDFEQARYNLMRLQGLPKYESHASLINGILLLQEQKPDDALEEFGLALEDPETRALALMLAGRTLLRQRKFPEAEQALQAALSIDEKLVDVHRLLGAAYYDVGDLRRSLAHLEKVAELAPGDPSPYQFMATIHRSFHQNELAIEDLREMLLRGATGSMRQDALLDMAQLQDQLLRHQEAIETLKEADESPDSLALLAECGFNLGDLDAARDAAVRALRLNPDHFDALVIKGQLDMEAKDVASAVEFLNRAAEIRPHNRGLHVLLSQAMHALGQDDLAGQHSEESARLRELEQQYSDLCSVAVDEPRNALTCYRLGLMAERLGMENEAAAWYRAVLLIDPQHGKARERLSGLPGGLDNAGG